MDISDEVTAVQPRRKKTLHVVLLTVSIIIVVLVGGWLYNELVYNEPLQRVLSSADNHSVMAVAHLDHWAEPGILVFDINGFQGDVSRVDVLRVFLQYAEAMKGHPAREVLLECRGNIRFEMDGAYFQQLGEEYSFQNPLYTIRTLPTHVTLPNGTSPYSEYEGGFIGVMTKEMEQFTDFSNKWYGELIGVP